ncbi:hypothetical protein Phum_PHUM220820 [Pediculus humanus corporis]|uniref:Uncharacterized protein n=1 Tax=Pediculus humanus subsp. corporis TaxID=121224 RepID=E0VI45_PEDHC|nr:uncharacterized protein Phum_PHUM220820 [Pediculus humanus corporis]EEB13051.1 hypothetical protein Phum_PHUM220820 [Pediculus humanus corporis]
MMIFLVKRGKEKDNLKLVELHLTKKIGEAPRDSARRMVGELDGTLSEEQFLSLEPPPLEDEYLFRLGPDEGLSDLFDFSFDLFDCKK